MQKGILFFFFTWKPAECQVLIYFIWKIKLKPLYTKHFWRAALNLY